MGSPLTHLEGRVLEAVRRLRGPELMRMAAHGGRVALDGDAVVFSVGQQDDGQAQQPQQLLLFCTIEPNPSCTHFIQQAGAMYELTTEWAVELWAAREAIELCKRLAVWRRAE